MVRGLFILWCLGLGVLTGCTRNESKGRPDGVDAIAPAGGGDEDKRIGAVIQSPWRDATRVDRAVRVEVLVNCPSASKCADDQLSTTNILASKIRIRDLSGKTTALITERNSDGGGVVDLSPFQYHRVFVASQVLEVDKPHILEATSDGDAIVAFADSSPVDLANQIASSNTKPYADSIQIFTGSAPFATGIEATSSKPVEYVRIRFSEPVALSSLVNDGISLTDSFGNPLQGCPWEALSRACAEKTSQTSSDLVDVMFSKALEYSVVSHGSLHLTGAISGTGGRTLKEGLGLAGVHPGAVLDGDDRTHVLLSAKDWESCSSDGSVSCIRSLSGY